MRMTMIESSTLVVYIATDETIRANNVGSGRSTPSKNFVNGLRLQVISPLNTLNYLSGLFMLGVVSTRVTEFFAIPRSG